jgi:hypothetical protein
LADQVQELETPQEIQDLFAEVQAANECRDACVKSVFRAERAIYYGKKAVVANAKAWALLKEIYPEMKEGRWVYSHETHLLKRL